ncbi:recombinase family protein [Pseudoflavitalea rhizosphaerae]|uniref:recombinase family protein n=1 Tax=Pseudoflavitalea rhizosphaerae TaxID=1884793 RepID=UPI000F8EB2C6|nr:recombinase family protein [Pseudoflavitalea rhizosphaerae]
MKSADLYIRVSTEEQKLTGFSQRYQEEILRTFCEINSIEISNIVLEDFSAKTFNRPNWSKLFAQYKSHKLQTPRLLLITRWDRFSRNTLDAYSMLDKLSKLGIEVQAVEQPLDLSIPENKLMMAFFLTIPEVENTRRSMEIKKGLRKGAKEGRWLGLAPYGYVNRIRENGEKYIEVVQTEARYMKMAFIDIAKNLHLLLKPTKTL